VNDLAIGKQSRASHDVSLKIDGEWNIGNAAELQERLSASLRADGDLVVDFGEVTAADTAILQLICSFQKAAAEQGCRLRIAAFSPAIQNIAAALGLPLGGDGLGL